MQNGWVNIYSTIVSIAVDRRVGFMPFSKASLRSRNINSLIHNLNLSCCPFATMINGAPSTYPSRKSVPKSPLSLITCVYNCIRALHIRSMQIITKNGILFYFLLASQIIYKSSIYNNKKKVNSLTLLEFHILSSTSKIAWKLWVKGCRKWMSALICAGGTGNMWRRGIVWVIIWFFAWER